MLILIGSAVVVFLTVAAVAVNLTGAGTREPEATEQDVAQIESTLRRFLQITTVDDPAFVAVTCTAYRDTYRGLRKTDITVYRPDVLSVDRIRITGDSATARVRAMVLGSEEEKTFDLVREDGAWKACPLPDR
ncbi:hypothetical protein [Nocardia sp. CC227C]|uniref:Rv0361 family membrane protein n=1 Tax=Nocardia sp. CC227C TaxID=3044562 RepID=UPI00278C7489|nr:hypothetical protein [Nocardia sp. CC227C]